MERLRDQPLRKVGGMTTADRAITTYTPGREAVIYAPGSTLLAVVILAILFLVFFGFFVFFR